MSFEHLPSPSKPRLSPLEFRNTDLVSRLLAATPPYLYNMSLLPNTYFFSEMLRSLVQAKAERASQMQPPARRPRKRNWATSRSECLAKPGVESKMEKPDVPADWMIKSNRKLEKNPVELTVNRPDNPDPCQNNFQPKTDSSSLQQNFATSVSNLAVDNNLQNLVLPPPPPMWYPPLYHSPPYGIDPLHFFIDLRVSGHIYDRKNQKENSTSPTDNFARGCPKDNLPHTMVSSDVKNEEGDILNNMFKKPQLPHTTINHIKSETDGLHGIFKQARHCSAFSVPVPSNSRNSSPINLSDKDGRPKRFDIKSMLLDKRTNTTSTNYILNNINSIYKNIYSAKADEDSKRYEYNGLRVETEEEREKRVKDLRALIGLELVVDYMNQKPGKSRHSESYSSTDVESLGSPALEVVALHDEN